jgi:hypothetical protein
VGCPKGPPAPWAGLPQNTCKAVLGVAHLQGVEGSGMAGPSETLGSSWPPLATRPWRETEEDVSLLDPCRRTEQTDSQGKIDELEDKK